jgi:hypothetical protein
LQDGNDREANIARWLNVPIIEKRVAELVVLVQAPDDEPMVVARWPRNEVTRELAPTIDRLIAEYANDCSANVKARLSLRFEDGTEWAAKALRAFSGSRPDRTDTLDGSQLSLIIQQSRHNEAIVQRLIEMTDNSEKRYAGVTALLERQLERTCSLLEKAIEEKEELANAAADAVEVAEEATTTAEAALAEAEEAKKSDQSAKVVDLVVKQLTGGMSVAG